jgi:hypothetical protein
MNKEIKTILSSVMILLILSGCGENPISSNKYKSANHEKVNDLAKLITSHPEIGRASLLQIKSASGEKTQLQGVALFSTVSEKDQELAPADAVQKPIDPKIASEADILISDILQAYDFKGEFESILKIIAIQMNANNKMFEHAKKQDPEKFRGFDESKLMTCEKFLDNPFMKISKEQFNSAMKANLVNLKDSLEDCPKIKSAEFLSCTQSFNESIALINEHANCSVQSINELNEILVSKTGKNIFNILKTIDECKNKHFKSCGFSEEKMDNIMTTNESSVVIDNKLNIEENNKN